MTKKLSLHGRFFGSDEILLLNMLKLLKIPGFLRFLSELFNSLSFGLNCQISNFPRFKDFSNPVMLRSLQNYILRENFLSLTNL